MPPGERCRSLNAPGTGPSAGSWPTGSGLRGPGASLASQAASAAETKHLAFETKHQGKQSFSSCPTSRLNRVFSLPYLRRNKRKRGFSVF